MDTEGAGVDKTPIMEDAPRFTLEQIKAAPPIMYNDTRLYPSEVKGREVCFSQDCGEFKVGTVARAVMYESTSNRLNVAVEEDLAVGSWVSLENLVFVEDIK